MKSTPILLLERSNDKIKITISDPSREVSSVPGLVRLTDIEFDNQMAIKGTLSSLKSALQKVTRIKSLSSAQDLQSITIETTLSPTEIDKVVSRFVSGKVERIGATPPPNSPPPPTDEYGTEYDFKTEATTAFEVNPMVIAAVVIAVLTLAYFKFR
jgi:hypothetical protein